MWDQKIHIMISFFLPFRFTVITNLYQCQWLLTNSSQSIPFLVIQIAVITMDSLFLVSAGERSLTCLLQPTQLELWNYFRWCDRYIIWLRPV